MSTPEIIPTTSPIAIEPRYTIFRGPDGIRAGWRVLIYIALVAAMFLAIGALITLAFHGRTGHVAQLSPFGTGLSEGVLFLAFAIPALIMGRVEHRRWAVYGLPGRSAFGKNFWVGSIAGFAAISGTLFAIYALHGFRLTGLNIHGSTIPLATAAWAAAFIIVGLAEEFAFRGYIQYTLASGIGYWPAAIVLSILFAAAHRGNPGETSIGLLYIVFFAMLFCLILRRTGNLWWPVGFHFGWDWGQTFFYGVPDSGTLPTYNLFNCSFSGPNWLTGGTVGPEASIFTPIALGVVAVIFAAIYRQNRYEIKPAHVVSRVEAPPRTEIPAQPSA